MEGKSKSNGELGKKAYDFLEKIGVHPCSNSSRSTMLTLSGPNISLPSNDQLTFFYGGRVFVFDGITETKAREIMHIASTAASNLNHFKKAEAATASHGGPVITRTLPLQTNENGFPQSQARVQPMNSPSLCNFSADLPIARRHSLQRFLEKRRDRLVSQNPYHDSSEKKTPEGNSDPFASSSNCYANPRVLDDEAKPEVTAKVI